MSELERPYYAILGVSSDATPAQIKAAYRDLVRLTHPDRGGDPDAFILLNQAYETLRDPERREEYDLVGEVHGWNPLEFHDALIQTLAGAFEKVVHDYAEAGKPIELVDVMAFMKEALGEGAAGKRREHRVMSDELDALHKLRKRIRRRGEAKNLFVEIIDAKIKEKSEALKDLTRYVDVAERAAEEIMYYDDVGDFFRTVQASRYRGSSLNDIFGMPNIIPA